MKLHTYPNDPNAYKALIAAEIVGVKIDVPSTFQFGVTNRTPEFLKLNPFGKVPTLETPQGGIFESNAIARYVARLADKGLFGTTPYEASQVEQWIDFSTNEINAPLMSWVLPLMGVWPYDKKKEEAAIESLKKGLATLNSFLESRTYMVGDAVTLADIVLVCNEFHGMTKVFDAGFRKAFPHVERHFVTCVNHPVFKKVMGEVALCKEVMKAPKDGGKAAAPAKEAKPAAAAKPAEAKPAAPKTPSPEDLEAAAAAAEKAQKQKVDDWLNSLPPTNMQMDGWKRLYSNSPARDFRNVCIARLWAGGAVPNSPNDEQFPGFDAAGYSFWFCDYKYDNENTVNFICMNKVSGFLQRMEFSRKYAFGLVSIFQKDGIFPIRGLWMFRGQEMPPQVLDECPDVELYDWKKVDLSDAAQKKRVEDMICEDDIDGMTLIETKRFK